MERPKNPPRGTYDLLFPASADWSAVESTTRNYLSQAGFQEIRTPIFEATEIFSRAAGESSDIVNKEMYTFTDKSDRSLTLRPEGTAGVVRAFLSNGLDRQPKPLRLWYFGSMFRYERSQTGRYRQFNQLGTEVFGLASPETDFENIYLAWNLLKKLGIINLNLEINSVGDNASRAEYQMAMRQFLKSHIDNICPDCQNRFKTNPLRVLDCKIPQDQALYQAQAPKIIDYLNEESKNHQAKLIELLETFEIPFTLNQALVRGLDYYTKTVFEIKSGDDRLSGQNTICAGGRYDNLVQEFGGPATPAFGWALGMERLMLLKQNDQQENLLDCFVIYPKNQYKKAFEFCEKLRNTKNLKVISEGFESNSQQNKIYKRAEDLGVKSIIYYLTGDLHEVKLRSPKGLDFVKQMEYLTESDFWQDQEFFEKLKIKNNQDIDKL
jgi:histidyl-tRNA synthetase